MTELKQANRSLWIDCFKAVTICLVVVGHTTGLLNRYIYQFHMAAFFCMAGFCTNWYRNSKLQLVWERFFTLKLPVIVIFLFGTVGMWILNITNIYSIFFNETMGYIGVKQMMYQFFKYGNNYVWWMGATWFLLILFKIIILHTILLYFIDIRKKERKLLYAIVVVLIYIWGFYYIHTENCSLGTGMLAIGQLYFGIGVLCRNTKLHECLMKETNIKISVAGIVGSVCIMLLFGHVSNITVDYPSGRFEHIVLNVLAAVNGIIFLFFLSKFVEKLFKKNKYIVNVINYVGRNTMGIVFFHFVMFKVCIGILVLFRTVDISYMQNFTPIEENVGLRYLWMFLLISIVGSVSIWKMGNLFYVGRVLLGNERELYRKWYVWAAGIIGSVYNKFEKIFMRVKEFIILFWNKQKRIPGWESAFRLSLLLMYFVNGILIVRQGVICNDELSLELLRKRSFSELLGYCINNELRMGRPLRIIAAINTSFTMLFKTIYLDRVIQVFLIGIALVVFYLLIVELFQKKRIAYTGVFLVLLCMPLTFEHGSPNAFIGLCVIPLIEVCISLIIWCRYLASNKRKYLVVSMLFWTVALGGYEFIVTYTPVFLMLYFLKKEKSVWGIKDIIKRVFPPVAIGCLYIVLTFTLQRILGSGYEGVTINLSSPSGILNVEKIICLSALPGYFLFNKKYLWMTAFYSEQAFGENIAQILARQINVDYSNIYTVLMSAGKSVEVVKIMLGYFFSVNVLLAIAAGIVIPCIMYHSKKEPEESANKHQHLFIFLCLVSYMLIPQLPNAISKLYQELVSEEFFTWIPVSIFLFFTACLCIAYIINLCFDRWTKRTVFILGIFILFIGTPVQYMNKVISDQNYKDYQRILIIQDLFWTDRMRSIQNETVYAPQLFETRNLLAVHGSYWSGYSNIVGNNLVVISERPGLESEDSIGLEIYIVDDSYFCLVNETETMVMSKKILPEWIKVQMGEDVFVLARTEELPCDNGFYCYQIRME